MLVGNEADFHAVASGNPTPTVRWQVSTDNGSTWNYVEGATDTWYSIFNTALALNGNQYRAEFNNAGGTVTTDAATLTVFNLPAAPNAPSASSTTSQGKMTVTLTWTDNSDGGSAITGHLVTVYKYRAATIHKPAFYDYVSSIETQSASTGATFTIKGGTYVFTVEAGNLGGYGNESGYSNSVSRH